MGDTGEKPDEMLAAEVVDGETGSFGVLIDRYEPRLARYARKFLGNADDRTDAVQDVFIRAYENIQSYDASRPFSPWIYRIAHNVFVNVLRDKKRSALMSLSLDTVIPYARAKETADELTRDREAKEAIEKGLNKLSPKYREVLILYYIEEFDYKTIADILHIPLGTVGIRIKRGREQLQTFIKEHHE